MAPDSFRYERSDRVNQLENGFEAINEHVMVGLDLGSFKIPIGEIVPEEGINGLAGLGEAVILY